MEREPYTTVDAYLKLVTDLLSPCGNWTQSVTDFAYDHEYQPCNPNDSQAACFTLFGAMLAVAGRRVYDPNAPVCPIAAEAYDILLGLLDGELVDEFNDAPNTTHGAVIALLADARIATVRQHAC